VIRSRWIKGIGHVANVADDGKPYTVLDGKLYTVLNGKPK